jgi:hypothetical protein
VKQLKKIQQDHFRKMSREERKSVIADAEKQMSAIQMSDSAAADHKREELLARIDFCQRLNTK